MVVSLCFVDENCANIINNIIIGISLESVAYIVDIHSDVIYCPFHSLTTEMLDV